MPLADLQQTSPPLHLPINLNPPRHHHSSRLLPPFHLLPLHVLHLSMLPLLSYNLRQPLSLQANPPPHPLNLARPLPTSISPLLLFQMLKPNPSSPQRSPPLPSFLPSHLSMQVHPQCKRSVIVPHLFCCLSQSNSSLPPGPPLLKHPHSIPHLVFINILPLPLLLNPSCFSPHPVFINRGPPLVKPLCSTPPSVCNSSRTLFPPLLKSPCSPKPHLVFINRGPSLLMITPCSSPTLVFNISKILSHPPPLKSAFNPSHHLALFANKSIHPPLPLLTNHCSIPPPPPLLLLPNTHGLLHQSKSPLIPKKERRSLLLLTRSHTVSSAVKVGRLVCSHKPSNHQSLETVSLCTAICLYQIRT
mmetsp:Transcript_37707/g.61114  ORF Transcript_37707/g.61114 Transcript_37707/m.61114 type:complete len:360 (+) Transcript_37707:1351-2430(+)